MSEFDSLYHRGIDTLKNTNLVGVDPIEPVSSRCIFNLQTTTNSTMLYTIAVILLILWLLGLVTSYTLGGFIHILLVVAIVIVLVRIIQGRSL